jgi:hypothetical protein
VLGTAGSENVQGEVQKKLDIIANEALIEATNGAATCAAMASEEMEGIYVVPNRYPQGEYLLLFDPARRLSQHRRQRQHRHHLQRAEEARGGQGVSEQDFLQAGSQQVAAGYCIYGPQTTLVLTVGDGVAMFTLDTEQGSFVLTTRSVRIPEDTKEFAINMSNMRHWDAAGEALHRRMPGRQGRPARQGLQHALDRLDGGGRAPHPHARRHLHVPLGQARAGQAGQAAPEVRGQPHGYLASRPAARPPTARAHPLTCSLVVGAQLHHGQRRSRSKNEVPERETAYHREAG